VVLISDRHTGTSPSTSPKKNSSELAGPHFIAAESSVVETCLVINGDQIVDSRIVRRTTAGHEPDSAATRPVAEQVSRTYGSVVVDVVSSIVENPRDDRGYFLNAGVYVRFLADDVSPWEGRAEGGGHHRSTDCPRSSFGETSRDRLGRGLGRTTYPWDLLDVSFELFDAGIVDGAQTQSGGVPERAFTTQR